LKVSIIIPTYNRANYLQKAIESALAQDYDSLEIIVSDNASSDSTEDLVRQYFDDKRFKYFKNKKNLGMVANWRKALFEHAEGDFFIILSDDDYFIDQHYVSRAVDLIKSDPEIFMVFSNGYIFYEDLNKKKELNLPFDEISDGKTVFLYRGRVKPHAFILCNVLFSRKLALKLNAFSNPNNISCDSELFLKMCLHGKVGVVNDFLSVYTIHSSNLIESMNYDDELIVNNIDHLIEPYKEAKSSGLFKDYELDTWVKEAVVPYYILVIEMVLLYHSENKRAIFKKIKDKDPEIFTKVLRKPKVKALIFLNKIKMLKLAFRIRRLI
jgi:glycosyltransferase involved in cell wall biosynthesis